MHRNQSTLFSHQSGKNTQNRLHIIKLELSYSLLRKMLHSKVFPGQILFCNTKKTLKLSYKLTNICTKARFKRRTFHVPNAIQTIDNEIYQLINYCLN